MFHNGLLLCEKNIGPYFYLPKLESSLESRLWDDLFVWAQEKLGIKIGTVKACVLIENIVAACQMEEILYSLRRHSFGLNCGIWDYCASIIAKFGRDPSFLLPDRNKYVNVDKHFLKKYMELTVAICRKRGTFATSGMATLIVSASWLVHLREKGNPCIEGGYFFFAGESQRCSSESRSSQTKRNSFGVRRVYGLRCEARSSHAKSKHLPFNSEISF